MNQGLSAWIRRAVGAGLFALLLLAVRDVQAQALAPCVCGFQDGRPTTNVVITINGTTTDWLPVLVDTDNNVCDNVGNQDRDRPIQSTGRDLRSFSYTWNQNFLYAYTTREASDNNRINFIYYADTDNDGVMELGEPVITAEWQGSNQSVTMEKGTYEPVNPAGDLMVDGNGYADGYNMPGTIENRTTFPTMIGRGANNGVEMEWRVRWQDLGIVPGAAITWHISSSNNDPFSQSIGAQIDDNMGGCGGGTGGTQFAALTFTPDHTNDVRLAQITYQSHSITNFGNYEDAFNLFTVASGGWSANSIQYYADNGTIGTYEPGTDVLLTDTDGDGGSLPDTGLIQSDSHTNILIRIQVPGAAGGTATFETTASSSFEPLVTETVFDVLTIVFEVSGFVYHDLNANNAKDGSEAGTGLTLYAKFLSASQPGGPAVDVVAVNPGSGYYVTLLEQGNYLIVIDNNNNPADVTPTIPSGWFGTEEPDQIRELTLVQSDKPNQNFGLFQGARISGTVFQDTGIGGGIANDGIQNGAEPGLANAQLAIAGGAFTASLTTDSTGTYSILVAMSSPTAFTITEVNPSGYISTGGDVGNSGGSYNRNTDVMTFTAAPGDIYTGVDFGDVPGNKFVSNNSATADPGSTVLYPHTFSAGTGGSVSFVLTETQSPANPLWSQVIYRDVNCNGLLEAGEPVINGAVAVTGGEELCIIMKQFIPQNAPYNAANSVLVTANFAYTGAAPALISPLSVTDLTTVGEATSGGLTLLKAVDKTTARPGDLITYTITYTHHGTDPLTQIVIQDYTPTFTTFVSAATGTLPTALTGVVITDPGAGAAGGLKWTFAGTLNPGGIGTVSFVVAVNQ